MAILNNCLCVFSVWTGSYIAGIYSIVYYSLHIVLEALLMVSSPSSSTGPHYGTLSEQRPEEVTVKMYTFGDNESTSKSPTGSATEEPMTEMHAMSPSYYDVSGGSTLQVYPSVHDIRHHTEPNDGSFIDYDPTTARLMMTVLFPAGILASALLLAALCWNKRGLMLPWLLLHPVITFIDMIEVLRILIGGKAYFSPITVFTFSGSMFLTSINAYSFLCVFSQYQDFKAGRLQESPPASSRVTQPVLNGSQRTTITSPSIALANRGPQQVMESEGNRPNSGPPAANNRTDLEAGGHCSTDAPSANDASDRPLTENRTQKSYESMKDAAHFLDNPEETADDRPLRKQVSFVH